MRGIGPELLIQYGIITGLWLGAYPGADQEQMTAAIQAVSRNESRRSQFSRG
jgi:hypothetical protein